MRPRLLVLSELFWPEGGGAELATYLIVDLLRKFFYVTVVTGSVEPALLPGVRYVYEPLLSKRVKPLLWLNTLKLIRTNRFERLLRESDVVYIPRLAFPVIPRAKAMGKKVIVHLHDYIPVAYSAAVLAPYEEHKHRITRDDLLLECRKGVKYCLGVASLWWLPRLAREWIKQTDRVVCVSKRQAEIVADQIPELKDKIKVNYNPAPPELLDSEPKKELDDTPTFLYAGGDSYVKGFHILLRALNKLAKHGVKAKFIFTNKYSPQNLKTLKKLSEKYSNLDIQILGKIEYREHAKLYKKTWALLFPSICEEPLPYAILEAMFVGTIPVASRVSDVPEITSGTLAEELMFTPGNSEEMVERIERILHMHRDQLVNIGYKLREALLKKFDRENTEQRLLKVFSM